MRSSSRRCSIAARQLRGSAMWHEKNSTQETTRGVPKVERRIA